MLSLRRLPSNRPPANRKRGKPKGLWKARVTRYPTWGGRQSGFEHDSDTDNEGAVEDEFESLSSSSSKRRRVESPESSDSEQIVTYTYYWNCAHSAPRRPPKAMNTASIASSTTTVDQFDLEDWLDLKDLFNQAAERYESENALEALSLLRGVIHECARFLNAYSDPTQLFSAPKPTVQSDDETVVNPPRKECKCIELPSALHSILGTALFLFGNLIAQDTSLALLGEPNKPMTYWLAALDVFETGESLPSRTSGHGCDAPEDWRMAIVWGRTLVCIADETLTRAIKSGHDLNTGQPTADFADEDLNWPQESPFATIAAHRPPLTRRMSFTTATADELMVLAMDQICRGIFHMPRPSSMNSPSAAPSFSRPKELYTIATEILLVAEKMSTASQRSYWAHQADSVFEQMKMENDADVWSSHINSARGRCWLIIGTAKGESVENALENGEDSVLNSAEAGEAKEDLLKAISFLEKAKSEPGIKSSEYQRELHRLLAEALVSLGNITHDEPKREELYARAQLEGGEELGNALAVEGMDTSE